MQQFTDLSLPSLVFSTTSRFLRFRVNFGSFFDPPSPRLRVRQAKDTRQKTRVNVFHQYDVSIFVILPSRVETASGMRLDVVL